jgi:integrase
MEGRLMPNKDGHRRFGSIRRRESGRYQARYRGPDGMMRSAPETFARKADAERYLSLVEAQMMRGEWVDPARGKIRLRDYGETWIAERPGLRRRTSDLYEWLLKRHIAPQLGNTELGRLNTQMIRAWRARLLAEGVSPTMAAKAYRLLRAILMTAVDEDKILLANPCRVKGAGSEHAPERPVLTIAQVFTLADRIGVRPVGNIHRRGQAYRLRYRYSGSAMRAYPELFATRADAELALWELLNRGQAEGERDTRFRALVLLAAFASLRWGEVTALRRCDIDMTAGTVQVRAAFTERSNGQMILGLPKSRAGLRTVSIPTAILPELAAHLAEHTQPGPDALVFTGVKGGPLRRSGFNKLSGWPHVVTGMGLPGLHFHDLRHAGNTLAADTGVSLRNLMARMGHDNERAALIYQHKSATADRQIADGLDALLLAAQAQRDGVDGRTADTQVPGG